MTNPFAAVSAGRCAVLRGLPERARDRGAVSPGTDLKLVVDGAYGVLWYRISTGHAPLSEPEAGAPARALIAQVRG